jgi:hypothetical protein
MSDFILWAGRTFACTGRLREAADVITGSEKILNFFADKHSLTATAIVDLIKNVSKNPEFNADDVDTYMLQRLQAAIDSGDLQVINMHKDGDGPQVLELLVQETRALGAETLWRRHDAAWAKGASAPQ